MDRGRLPDADGSCPFIPFDPIIPFDPFIPLTSVPVLYGS
jgi:hypothetical protein